MASSRILLFWMLLGVGTLMVVVVDSQTIELPPFTELKKHYPGFYHFGGPYRHHDIIKFLNIESSANLLLHDTTALRMSYTLNRIGNQHSLGSDIIRLSKYGTDSVPGKYGLQYIFHPLAFGPYLADKYGYPTVTKMHLFDPVKTKEFFTNKQGIMRVITYTQEDNIPKGHIVLWDCDDFYEARDFFKGHTLLSVEFWESPDTSCQSTSTEVNTLDERESKLLSLIRQHIRHITNHRKHLIEDFSRSDT
ncbi:hypothetical protein ACF0H5_008634 [Mactra antiquata]